MDVFGFADYKKFVNEWVAGQKKGGRGQYRRFSEIIGSGTVYISQVFKGDRDITPDQAILLAEYLGLTELETEYFVLLVHYARAGTEKYRRYVSVKLKALAVRAANLKERLPQDIELDVTSKAQFYSDWHYSAIRNLTAIEGYQTIEAISERLSLPRAKVASAVEFLLAAGLCVTELGRLKAGPKKTHLESGSYLIKNRQMQWRLMGFQKMDVMREDELFYTAPMSLSAEAIALIRSELVQTIQRVVKSVEESKSEELACLNIDWFRF